MDINKLSNHVNIVLYDCFLHAIFFFSIFTSHISKVKFLASLKCLQLHKQTEIYSEFHLHPISEVGFYGGRESSPR